MDNAAELRQAMLAAPLESSSFGEEPLPGTLYIPPSHVKAAGVMEDLKDFLDSVLPGDEDE